MKILDLKEDEYHLTERPKEVGQCYTYKRARNKCTRKTCEIYFK